MPAPLRVLVTTSTLPASDTDPVPAFVRDQAIALSRHDPSVVVEILAPHNAYSATRSVTQLPEYTERRFHYFWPARLELLAGRGIAPALKRSPWLYLQIPFLFLFQAMATIRRIRSFDPDVVYAHWFTPQAITAAVACAVTRRPFCFTTHASDVAILHSLPFGKRIVQGVCRRAARYTAVSRQTADRLLAFFDAEARADVERKLSIVPMGTDVDLQGLDGAARAESLRRLGVAPGELVVLAIGRVVRRKGFDYLVRAVAGLDEQARRNVRLVVAGDGPDLAELQGLAASLPVAHQVSFPGYVTGVDKEALLDRADVVCLPSVNEGVHAEGMPVVFMEALARGKPVVATDVSGAQEYLDSATGFLVPERDPGAIGAALAQVQAQDEPQRAAMQTAARALAQSFAWDTIAKEYRDILEETSGQRPARQQ